MFTKLHAMEMFLIDLDGTVCLDGEPIPHVKETIKLLKDIGKKVCFLTNNSSKSKAEYIAKLKKLGYDLGEDDIFSSQQATIFYLKEKYPKRKVFLLGTSGLKQEFLREGIMLADSEADGAEIVVVGYDTELTYEKLSEACLLIKKGIPFIATHPDIVCPSKRGGVPDVGSFLALIEVATGRKPDAICGKPSKILARAIEDKFKIPTKKMAMVGDRLYTDMAFAIDNEMCSVLVFSGETTREDYEQWRETHNKAEFDFALQSLADMRIVLMRR